MRMDLVETWGVMESPPSMSALNLIQWTLLGGLCVGAGRGSGSVPGRRGYILLVSYPECSCLVAAPGDV